MGCLPYSQRNPSLRKVPWSIPFPSIGVWNCWQKVTSHSAQIPLPRAHSLSLSPFSSSIILIMEKVFETHCQAYFHEGLKAAFLTDRDGVIILKCKSAESQHVCCFNIVVYRYIQRCARQNNRSFDPHELCCCQQSSKEEFLSFPSH